MDARINDELHRSISIGDTIFINDKSQKLNISVNFDKALRFSKLKNILPAFQTRCFFLSFDSHLQRTIYRNGCGHIHIYFKLLIAKSISLESCGKSLALNLRVSNSFISFIEKPSVFSILSGNLSGSIPGCL